MVQRIKKWVGILTAGVLLLGGVPLEKAAAESSVSVSAASCVVMEAVKVSPAALRKKCTGRTPYGQHNENYDSPALPGKR